MVLPTGFAPMFPPYQDGTLAAELWEERWHCPTGSHRALRIWSSLPSLDRPGQCGGAGGSRTRGLFVANEALC